MSSQSDVEAELARLKGGQRTRRRSRPADDGGDILEAEPETSEPTEGGSA